MKTVLSAICASALVVTVASAAEPILAPGYFAPTPSALNLKAAGTTKPNLYHAVQAPAVEPAPPAPAVPPKAYSAPPQPYAAPPVVHSAPAAPLYHNVKVKDPHHAHPCAVPTVIPVPDPCGGPGCVYIQICAPPCGPVDVRHRLLKTVIDYGDGYEVELRARRGMIIVDYDD
ncbi:hypothetical protein Mal4_45580 [Maioricimonas rarisocia]|uniref:Uncharacterized protein n=1 Tax=Maioricimonas rarisocia TaxID=2528026 RepID=A0A517ZCH7_9PLAN|nr:hypothetical protein [Maioricimonas rarisocia]QDU40203.1 hypothetical protein Mal4_45580 [Maioricimonas rarisocia]